VVKIWTIRLAMDIHNFKRFNPREDIALLHWVQYTLVEAGCRVWGVVPSTNEGDGVMRVMGDVITEASVCRGGFRD